MQQQLPRAVALMKTGSGVVLERFWGTPCIYGRPRASGTTHSHFRRLLGSHFCHFLVIFFLLVFLVFQSCSFGDFAATRVAKVAKKGAKMEPKALPERLRDMCQKHAIYCTGSTSAPPGSVLKPDVSPNPFREAPGSLLEAHFCDSSTVLGSPLGSVLRPWSLQFSVHFLDAFLRRPTTS